MPIILKSFQKKGKKGEEEGTFPNSFYKINITLLSVAIRAQSNELHEHRCKNSQKKKNY
jgi:hypothetical protein